MKSILWADVRWKHMGSHSGMVSLSKEVAARWGEGFQRVGIRAKETAITTKAWRKLRAVLNPSAANPEWRVIRDKYSPIYSEQAWGLEKEISRQVSKTAPDYVFLECIEEQLFLLSQERKDWPKTRLVGITHQPPAWWRLHHGRPAIVSSLDLLVVVAPKVKPYWAQFIDPDKIAFLPHGVDMKFFSPLNPAPEQSARDSALRVIFSGFWLRDFKTLAEVVNMADQQALNVTFDLIVPHSERHRDACYQMAMSPKVRWHAHLSDEELRAVYQQADILLLTLTDSTANNGLLEGMACGLPAIVTDVGGVRDYANEGFADLVAPGDATEIVQLLKRHIADRRQLAVRGAAARAHVEQNLSWTQVAEKLTGKLSELD